MANEQKLGQGLQIAVLAALVFDARFGSAIAVQVNPGNFDTKYRDFAGRVLRFRQKYRVPPGTAQLSDLVAQSGFGKESTTLARIEGQLLAERESLNAEYIATRTHHFVRRQQLKQVTQKIIDCYQSGVEDESLVDEVERLMSDGLINRSHSLDVGMWLNDPSGLDDILAPDDVITLGIPELDKRGIGLVPKEMLLYIAPKNTGKTWFCSWCGRQALLAGAKVVHISLEMGERKMFRRYIQTLFAVSRTDKAVKTAVLKVDELGKVVGWGTEEIKPTLYFSDPKMRDLLKKKIKSWGGRFGHLVIKAFPTNQLKVDQLAGYLDFLADVHDFIPRVLIVDYPDLMVKGKDFRVSIGDSFESLRGLAVERNLALVCPTQSNRATLSDGKKWTRGSDAAEDIRKVNAADTVLTYSQTSFEKKEKGGMARLRLEFARDQETGTEVLLTQSYATGQYVRENYYMPNDYLERMKKESALSSGSDDEGVA